MRRFVCPSCGKNIELNWCTNRRGREIQCPDCGSRVFREHGVGNTVGAGRGGLNMFSGTAGKDKRGAGLQGNPKDSRCGQWGQGQGLGQCRSGLGLGKGGAR